MCTKELVATDCMEYLIHCETTDVHDAIGLTCQCGDCEPVVRRTNRLATCPYCSGPLKDVIKNATDKSVSEFDDLPFYQDYDDDVSH